MAEYRPYRNVNSAARARLTRVKLIAVSSFLLLAVLINWIVTQHVARLFGYAPGLGPSLIGNIYAPWAWLAWWTHWHWAEQLQPLWELCLRQTAYPLFGAGALAAGSVIIARYLIADDTPDLHGSARWSNAREVWATGFLAPVRILPRWLRRWLVSAGLQKAPRRRDGIYLGAWRERGRLHYLRDCGQGHVLLEAPTRAGKGVNTIVPTLLAWPHSALIHDFKRELWPLTAGGRQQNGSLCFKFDPANPDDPGVRYNPLEEVRLRTPYETGDVQNVVEILVDPDGNGFNSESHWVQAGKALLTGAILHLLYAEPVKTLRGLSGLLSDPEAKIQQTIERIMTTEHDPDGTMGWRTSRGAPTRTHPLVAESMREVLDKAEKERSGVISEVVTRLPLYRDPLIAAATECSDFKIDDLVNRVQPVSLYLVVPFESRDRLKPLTRLMINQFVRRLTATLSFRNGRAVSPHRHPLLLMLDEFGLLGRFEVFAEAMSHMAGFGLRACLAVQSFNQIYKSYGRHETITSNCDTTIRFTPNDLGTAEEISRLIGQTNVRHEHRTKAGAGGSISEPEVGRSLMTADEVRRMSVEEVLIFARGQRPIRAPLLKYHEVAYFRRLAEIEPPANSDRIVAEPAAEDVPNNSPVMVAAAAQTLPQADLPLGWALNHAAKESGGK
jgi:type IV secretion system protein VirD4